MKPLIPYVVLASLILSGCITAVSTNPGDTDHGINPEPMGLETWHYTLTDSAILVHVVAEEEWSMTLFAEFRDDQGYTTGAHFPGNRWIDGRYQYDPNHNSLQIRYGDIHIDQHVPYPGTYIPDNGTVTREFTPGNHHLVLWSHNIVTDFTIEGANVTMVAEDRDMYRWITPWDGEWDYNHMVYLGNFISHFDASRTIEMKYPFVQLIGDATSSAPILASPSYWENVTSWIGEHECTGREINPPWWSRFDHRGTGDFHIEAATNMPGLSHDIRLHLFDLPLEAPEPFCRKELQEEPP